MCETLQDKKISSIASQITADKRIVLIAGPSSSGKTTFSLKLSTHLRCKGLNPVTLCMDNYYVNRVNTPLDKDGKYDFEHVEAIDIPLFNQQLSALCRGEKVITPIFDFQTGTRKEGPAMQLEEGGIIVCEGIHGLNPRLSEQVAPEHKFKIFISPLTMLNIDDHHRISTTNNRLIRRIVRDNQFRGHSPEATINMWPSVGRGEEKWIFPHQYQADVYMNSALDYELGVLAGYVTPLLHAVPPTSSAYTKARTLLNFLSLVQTIPETAVPMHSILREFIGRSAFHGN
ncbi:uridine kinase-like protein [Kipferlia bialata]|uniref:Uridine kinase-like protein n=1 Tax=Kipferlia bialata TaxID=797122 RepID=A0A391NQK0_9EUKA|nr:uridine kinase-like protein [Kipferlia bialata]|eukprot:g7858.t1